MSSSDQQDLLEAVKRLEDGRDRPSDASMGNRYFHRFVVRGDCELTPVNRRQMDQSSLPVALRDIGRGGMGFLSPREIAVGSVWRAGFLLRDHIVAQQTLMVRYCQQIQEDVHRVGCDFCLDNALFCLLGVDLRELDLADRDAKAVDITQPTREVA